MESYLILNTLYGKRTKPSSQEWVFENITLPLPKGDAYMTAKRISCEESGLLHCIDCSFEYRHRDSQVWEKTGQFTVYAANMIQLLEDLNIFCSNRFSGEAPQIILPLSFEDEDEGKVNMRTGDYYLRNFKPMLSKVLGLGGNAVNFYDSYYDPKSFVTGVRKAKLPSTLDCYIAMDILEASTYTPTMGFQPILTPISLIPTENEDPDIRVKIIEVPRYVKLQERCHLNRIALSLRYCSNGEVVKTTAEHEFDLVVECLYKARLQLAF